MLNLDRAVKPLLIVVVFLFLAGGGVTFYRMVDQMARMTELMAQMSGDIQVVSREMTAMRVSMERMEGHVGKMGQGVKEIERVNPMRMFPGSP
ncbi:hypothetical protein [Endothiovibrio diazotrophicus]